MSTILGGYDIDGDDFADLVVGAPYSRSGATSEAGAVAVIPGSRLGLVRTPSRVVYGTAYQERVGTSIGVVVSPDGMDGSIWLAAGAPGARPFGAEFSGAFHAHAPGATTPTVTIPGMRFDMLGGSACLGADLNGDGFGDLVIGRPSPFATTNVVLVYPGDGLRGPDSLSSTTVDPGVSRGNFGASLAAGDVDGDGRDDLAIGPPALQVGASVTGAAYVYRGNAMPLVEAAPHRWYPGTESGAQVGAAVVLR